MCSAITKLARILQWQCDWNNACINIFHRWTSQTNTLKQPREPDSSKTLQERVSAGLLKKARNKEKRNKWNESTHREFNQSEREEAGSACDSLVKLTCPRKHIKFAPSLGKGLIVSCVTWNTERESGLCQFGLFKICENLKMLCLSNAISHRRQSVLYKQASNALKMRVLQFSTQSTCNQNYD